MLLAPSLAMPVSGSPSKEMPGVAAEPDPAFSIRSAIVSFFVADAPTSTTGRTSVLEGSVRAVKSVILTVDITDPCTAGFA
jgi:hypothetical protein